MNQAISAAIITKMNQNKQAKPFLSRLQQSGNPDQVHAIGEDPLGQMVISFGPTCTGAYTISDDAKATENVHRWLNQMRLETMRSNKKHKTGDDRSSATAKSGG